MSRRQLFVDSALLVLLFTGAALAGQYQQTKDGRTLVWNEDHKPDEWVSWSGKRDADGYATGHGTLTWYTPDDVLLQTGSNLPRQHYRVSSSVTGTMVHGRFGEAPPGATAPATIEPEKPKKSGWMSIFKRKPKPTPTPIEATPEPQPKLRSAQFQVKPEKPNPAPTKAAAAPTPRPTPAPGAASNSLESLMHAPSSLKLNSPAASPSPAISSPTATPDVSLQLTQPSPPPTP